MGCAWALDPKVKVTTPKLFDGTESVPQVDPMDQIRACIRAIITDILDGANRVKGIVSKSARPYGTAV